MNKLPKRGAAEITDHLLETEPEQKRFAKKILQQQNRLKDAVSADVYGLYLDVEATSNQRWQALTEHVYNAGRAQGRREARAAVRRRSSHKKTGKL